MVWAQVLLRVVLVTALLLPLPLRIDSDEDMQYGSQPLATSPETTSFENVTNTITTQLYIARHVFAEILLELLEIMAHVERYFMEQYMYGMPPQEPFKLRVISWELPPSVPAATVDEYPGINQNEGDVADEDDKERDDYSEWEVDIIVTVKTGDDDVKDEGEQETSEKLEEGNASDTEEEREEDEWKYQEDEWKYQEDEWEGVVRMGETAGGILGTIGPQNSVYKVNIYDEMRTFSITSYMAPDELAEQALKDMAYWAYWSQLMPGGSRSTDTQQIDGRTDVFLLEVNGPLPEEEKSQIVRSIQDYVDDLPPNTMTFKIKPRDDTDSEDLTIQVTISDVPDSVTGLENTGRMNMNKAPDGISLVETMDWVVILAFIFTICSQILFLIFTPE